VRSGNKRGFELRRREEDAAVEHFAEIASVEFGVGAFGPGVVGDRLRRKENGRKRADAVDLGGDSRTGEGVAEAVDEFLGERVDAFVEAGLGEFVESGDARAHCEGIAGERPGLIDRA